jgi:hypothetical protein
MPDAKTRRIASATLAVCVLLIAFAIGRRLWGRYGHAAIRAARAVRSPLDGQHYRVQPKHGGAQRAADTLAAINSTVVDLLRHLRHRYRGDGTSARGAAVARLLARYNPDNLVENSPLDPTGDTSYTVDKGAILALCLRERDPAASGDAGLHDIHALDTLMFVTIHELAHAAIDEVDHPPKFWATFRWLLIEAEAGGVYKSPDFARAPETYCGIRVDYNPRYDPAAPMI